MGEWLNIAVVVVAEQMNRKLSVVSPPQLTQLASITLVPTDDANAVRRVMFENQTSARQSTTEPTSSVVNSILANFVLESLRITLYWGSTVLVMFTFSLIQPTLSETSGVFRNLKRGCPGVHFRGTFFEVFKI